MYIKLSCFLIYFYFDLFCQLVGGGGHEKVAITCLDTLAKLTREKQDARISYIPDLTFITSSQLSNNIGTRSLVLWI